MPEETIKDTIQENAQEVVEKAQQEVAGQRETPYKSLRKTSALISIYLLQFLAFTLLAVFVASHPIIPLDIAITKEFQENQTPWLQMTMIGVSWLGNMMPVFIALIVLTAIAFWLVRLRLEAIVMICLPSVSALINYAIKLIVGRPRPTASLVEVFQVAGGASFPSGHVMAYVAYFGLLFSFGIILFRRDHWWTYALLIIPAFFVVMVGPSRIYLGDHWASDVLGAYIFGGILLGITLWIYQILRRRGVLTTKLGERKHHSLRWPHQRQHLAAK
jgi:membrane-associated phospholipid phosphatase